MFVLQANMYNKDTLRIHMVQCMRGACTSFTRYRPWLIHPSGILLTGLNSKLANLRVSIHLHGGLKQPDTDEQSLKVKVCVCVHTYTCAHACVCAETNV